MRLKLNPLAPNGFTVVQDHTTVVAGGTSSSTTGGATTLSDLTDVDATVATPTDGDILVYRDAGSDWVLEAKPAGGSNPALNDVTDVTITTVGDNEVLAYDNGTSTWINQTASEAGLASASHTHTASEITNFDTEVSNNTDVAANTASRHDAVTVLDSSEIDFTLTGQQITASIIAGSIDETKLDTSTNASLDLADSSVQPGDNISTLTNDAGYTTNTGDVVGPASATDNAVARFDSTTGKLLQNSNATIDDSGNLTIGGTLKATGNPVIQGATAATSVQIQAGQTTFNDGRITLSPNGTSSGGDVTITAGSGEDVADNGGNIYLEPGADGGSGTDGKVAIKDPVSANLANINTASLTTNRTITIPDASGTIEYEGHTHTASEITDFDTEVSNNTDVAANTSARHAAVTVTDSSEIDFTLTGQNITASIITGSIDETKLDASTNASLDLADSSVQPGDNISTLTNDSGYLSSVTAANVDSGASTDGQVLTSDGAGNAAWESLPAGGSGDVVGPASSTDNAIARFDGTTGKLIQNSGVTVGDDSSLYADYLVVNSDGFGAGGVQTDTIGERTASAGVTIDSVLIKDGLVDGVDVSTTYRSGGTDVAVADGGTGASSHTSGNYLIGAGTSAITSKTPSAVAIEVGSLLFPVGSIYANYSDSTNPATLLGFGTWVQISDRILVGQGSGSFATATSTGGSETKTLTTTELPAHTHGITDPGHIHSTSLFYTAGGTGSTNYSAASPVLNKLPRNTDSATTGITVDSAGSGSAFNIMNPYVVVYLWRRTA